MFDNDISLNKILVSFEGVLKLEVNSESRVDDILKEASERLENMYNITLDRDLYAIQAENQLTAERINKLLHEVQLCLEQLTFYVKLKEYHKNPPISLSDVNYLGFAKVKLMTCLKYLRDDELSKQYRNVTIPPLRDALNNISICTVKRLFIIMLMLDKLGVDEGVMVVADFLYLGGIVS